ncbi:segregation and condensation protein A [Marinobacter fonticola]|uniref:segregation and condensation protein A n=1 Tax=Marinobacter fonticola TaxID=2603215 RepID=UPI0011E80865|nr:segregation/condensation protein A [Marinobacter fonticola]
MTEKQGLQEANSVPDPQQDPAEAPASAEASAEAQAIARVSGKPLRDLPQDLYIPPDALAVFLEAFEGPLDLLLYLIRRQNMDILDIDVSEITRQYMEYINAVEAMRFELAAEYLVMAATLAEIKSRMLLPRQESEEEDEVDPRAELIRRLQQYERFKKAAEDLDAVPRMERDTFGSSAALPRLPGSQVHPDVELKDMLLALRDVLHRADLFTSHHVEREKLSTRERMSHILSCLTDDRFVNFESLFTVEEGRLGVVVTFLATLELVKEQLIEVVQAEVLGPIHVRARAVN